MTAAHLPGPREDVVQTAILQWLRLVLPDADVTHVLASSSMKRGGHIVAVVRSVDEARAALDAAGISHREVRAA